MQERFVDEGASRFWRTAGVSRLVGASHQPADAGRSPGNAKMKRSTPDELL